MKKFILIAVSFLALMACKDKADQNNGMSSSKYETVAPQSQGRINHVTVIVSNEKWNGDVGEAIRDVLAAPVLGLPQEEPLFSIKQMPAEAVNEFAAKSRLILKVASGNPNFSITQNQYAKPQSVALITGNTDDELIALLKENGKQIVKAFKATELTEKQRRINLSLHNIKALEDNLGITVNFPSAYRIASKIQNPDKTFFWAKKNIPTGSMNLLFYQVPINSIDKDSVVKSIIKIRDSIGEAHIPGPTDGTYQITEKAFSPFLYKEVINNKPTFVTKGTWEVNGAIMAGPFVNFAIEDKANDRYVVLEGFAYSPSVQKRDYMFELEAIIKSVRIK